MPIELRFASPELRAICECADTAKSLLGDVAAQKLRTRLSDVRAASNIRQVVLGRPEYSRRGRVTVCLSDTHRLVLAPADTRIPRQSDKLVDWARVNILEVVEIY